jgi:GT2 family glycosyltransferase
VDPLQHFVTHGAREGRNPNPHFWSTWYLKEYPDVAATGMNPLLHFVRSGWKEGRNPNPNFSTADYLKKHEEARLEHINPLLHFLVNDPTAFQNRAPGEIFRDEDWDAPWFSPHWRARLNKAALPADLTVTLAMAVHRTPLSLLERAVRSVVNQEYPHWELCMVDDGSRNTLLRSRLEAWGESDPRIKVAFHETRKGPCAALNHAIAMGTGEFVAILGERDVLAPEALGEVAALLAEQPETDVVYSDLDTIDETGRRYQPVHKPAWSPVHFLGSMYVDHLMVLRHELLARTGGFDSRFETLPEFELLLRLSESTSCIRHIPKILYHSGAAELGTASSFNPGVAEVQALAVNEHLHRRNIAAKVVVHPQHPRRILLESVMPVNQPRVSIIIPSSANSPLLADCLRSVVEKSTHTDYEIILLLQTGSVRTETQRENVELARSMDQVRVVEYDFPFNYSRVNNLGAGEARGELLVLLNDDTKVITPEWLEIMTTHLSIPGVGAVGAKLLYPTGAVQHAGIVLGFRGSADHVMRGSCADSDGYHGSLSTSREVSAVTAACLMTRKDTYLSLKGMNECYASIYQDVDYCLRVRQTGLSVLCAANAELVHHECATRSSEYNLVDREIFIDRWRGALSADPFYNIHFTRNRHDYTLRTPPA